MKIYPDFDNLTCQECGHNHTNGVEVITISDDWLSTPVHVLKCEMCGTLDRIVCLIGSMVLGIVLDMDGHATEQEQEINPPYNPNDDSELGAMDRFMMGYD